MVPTNEEQVPLPIRRTLPPYPLSAIEALALSLGPLRPGCIYSSIKRKLLRDTITEPILGILFPVPFCDSLRFYEIQMPLAFKEEDCLTFAGFFCIPPGKPIIAGFAFSYQ